MKQFIKHTTAWIVAWVISFAIMDLYRRAVLMFGTWTGATSLTVTLAILAVSVAGGAVQTIKEHGRNRRATQLLPMILAEAIETQQIKLAKIDAEPPSTGRTRRRATCRITLVALEEKRERMIGGKDGRWKHESHSFEHQTRVVGEDHDRGEKTGDQKIGPEE